MDPYQNPFSRYFIKCDLFGRRVDFSVKNQILVKSKLGAFVSCIIIGLALYLFVINIISWRNMESLQTISSFQNMNVNDLLYKNQNFVYNFDYSNYGLYVVLSANFPNGTMINYEQLEPYLTQNFVYTNQSFIENNIGFSKCLLQNQDIFLQLDDSIIQSDFNKTSDWRVCINQTYLMGLFTDQTTSTVSRSTISYRVNKCQNSTENDFSCASEEEIESILPYVSLQMTIPKSNYDFTNPSNPRKRTYDYQFYYFDINLMKSYTGFLLPVYLKTDVGIISDDYILNSVDFNVENIQYVATSRNSDDFLLKYDLTIYFDQQFYYRKNLKLSDLIANFGGMLNILLLFGKLLCHFYNFMVLKHELLNISFRNLDKAKPEGKLGNSKRTIEPTFRFSPFKFLCPRIFLKKSTYDVALTKLNEYMDIKNIIKRLQDIDKMKMVVFDDKQRRVFENLPKPGIVRNTGSLKSKSHFTTELMLESKISREPVKTNEFLLNSDPMNKRMLDMMDPMHKTALDMMDPIDKLGLQKKNEIKNFNLDERVKNSKILPKKTEIPFNS